MKRNVISILALALMIGVAPIPVSAADLSAPASTYNATADVQAELDKYGITGLTGEDPEVDLNNISFTGADKATIGFKMYLDPDSDLFDSSDTMVSFTHEKSGIRFTYTFSHLTDYDKVNHLCTGIIQIPADSYFDSYDITVYTVSNGFNGGNLCYQETVQPVAGQTYGLYAAAGSTDWLKTDGANLLKDQKALGSELSSDSDAKAKAYENSEKAKSPKGIESKEKTSNVTVSSESHNLNWKQGLSAILICFDVLAFVFLFLRFRR